MGNTAGPYTFLDGLPPPTSAHLAPLNRMGLRARCLAAIAIYGNVIVNYCRQVAFQASGPAFVRAAKTTGSDDCPAAR